MTELVLQTQQQQNDMQSQTADTVSKFAESSDPEAATDKLLEPDNRRVVQPACISQTSSSPV